MVFFALIFSMFSMTHAVSQENLTANLDESKIILQLASSFFTSNDDFLVPRQHSTYFPLTNAKAVNKRLGRYNYDTINSEEHENKITGSLRTWRGFPDLRKVNLRLPFMDLMLTTFSTLFPLEEDLSRLQFEGVQSLPRGWQYLLPRQVYSSLDALSLANLVNTAPSNMAMLYKMAISMRNANNAKKQQFMEAINLSGQVREDLGYIIGYRWSMADNVLASDDLKMSTLLLIPSDVVMDINMTNFELLNLSSKLEDKSSWEHASQQARVAWYTMFDKYMGWKDVGGTPYHVVKHGHLMSGAPLLKLKGLKGQQDIETPLLAEIIEQTPLDSIRAQEIWEALSTEDMKNVFLTKAMDLDISQVLAYYNKFPQYKDSQRTQLEELWLSGDFNSEQKPWVNVLKLALNHMDDEEYVSWNKQQLTDLGKFAAILSPAEIELIPTKYFDSEVMAAILSPAMDLCHLSTIYDKFLKSGDSSKLHPLLLSAVHSSDLVSYTATAPFIWSQDRTSLLTAARIFTPAQTKALQELSRPGYWKPANMSAILSTNPRVIADVIPQGFKFRLDNLVQGVYHAGPQNFYSVVSKIQELPRHLLMAWLEEVHERPGGKILGKYWNSDVLLDRITDHTIPDNTVTNPDPSHPLAAQFDRFTSANKSLLPSLALQGMSCHCIDLVETQDTLEVLALFRFYLERDGGLVAMPSSSRKCWAKKVRQFLNLKSMMFNITIDTEPELLSLLTTSDIKTIGGEVLATWGGPALASITHPEVMHEVLMAIGHLQPHLFVRNGVTYNCMKVMANALMDTMIREEGKVNFRVLTHVHNLIPYSDKRVLEASAEDMKLFITTVLKPVCKAVCLKAEERELVRQMILKAYGPSKSWTALDLTDLGDLLVMMARSDLRAVQPTALRRAAHELSKTLWTSMLSDIRGYTKEVLYHEACGAWLGGLEGRSSTEAIKFHNQWTMFGNFIVVGSFLQVEVLINEAGLPAPRTYHGGFRRKRQVDAGLDIKTIYGLVMQDMKTKFDAKELTDDQKTEATRVITETQKLLGDTSFTVLGLERGDKSQSEVLAVLAEYKEAENMTESQNTEIKKLAVDTQVRMIQELVGVLNLTASDLGLTTEQLDIVMARHTFVLKSPGEPVVSVNTTELLDIKAKATLNDTESSADDVAEVTTILPLDPSEQLSPSSLRASSNVSTTVTVSSTTLSSSGSSSSTTESTVPTSTTASTTKSTTSSIPPIVSSSSTTEFSPLFTSKSTTTLSTTKSPPTTTTVSSTPVFYSTEPTDALGSVLEEEHVLQEILDHIPPFKYYEPSSVYFSEIPALDDLILSCDVLIASGTAATSISSTQLSSMSAKEVENCLDTLGHLPWSKYHIQSLWEVVKIKVNKLKESSMRPIKRQEMLLLKNLLPAIALEDPTLLDMSRSNIDGISYLGSLLESSDPMVLNLVQLYISLNDVSISTPFTTIEAASLGQLLCGLRDVQWEQLITKDVFVSILTGHLSKLECRVNNTTSLHLASMLTWLYGPTHTWTSSDLLSTGWLASTLSPEELAQLNPHAMEGLTGQAVKFLTKEQIHALSHMQVAMMAPHAASFISKEQLMPYTNMNLRRGIRAAGGEDERLVATMEKVESEMQVVDMEMNAEIQIDPVGDNDERIGSGVSHSSCANVIVVSLVFMMVLGI